LKYVNITFLEWSVSYTKRRGMFDTLNPLRKSFSSKVDRFLHRALQLFLQYLFNLLSFQLPNFNKKIFITGYYNGYVFLFQVILFK